PTLDHEVADHPVEDHAVVEAVARELAEVLDGLRGVLVEQLERDRPVVGVHRRLTHLLATSNRSVAPRTACPDTLSITSSARLAVTPTKLKRSSPRPFVMPSPPRCELSTIAPITSAGSRPWERPPDTISFTTGPSTGRRGLVWRGRRVS